MELVRWRPRRYGPVAPYDFDRAFDRLLQNWAGPASLPEFDWNPSIDDNNLVISGEKKQESEEKDKNKNKNKNYYRVERSYGSFRRSLA